MKKIVLCLSILGLITSCSKSNINLENLSKKKNDSSGEASSNKISSSHPIAKVDSSTPLTLSLLDNSSSPVTSKPTASKSTNQVNESNRVDSSLIPIKFSIQYKNGNGNNQIAVFLDLNQDFTKDFIENQIPSIKDTTINVFIVGGDDEAIEKIYCSDNKIQSLSAYLNHLKIENQDRNCDKDGLDYYKKYYQDTLSQKTLPIVIFSDGNLVDNALSANSSIINQYLGE